MKGLKGKALETWNLVSEGLLACREDILSGEERLAEDMCRFEVNLRVLYEDVSANKVSPKRHRMVSARVVGNS